MLAVEYRTGRTVGVAGVVAGDKAENRGAVPGRAGERSDVIEAAPESSSVSGANRAFLARAAPSSVNACIDTKHMGDYLAQYPIQSVLCVLPAHSAYVHCAQVVNPMAESESPASECSSRTAW
jgi:hypothetical protein